MPNLEHLCRSDVTERRWEYIVIHHSATAKGNAARFDYYHKKKKGWEYGLAYHFVIGNGSFSGNGEIEVSNRWEMQIHGLHTANMNCNHVAIEFVWLETLKMEALQLKTNLNHWSVLFNIFP